MTTPRDSGSFGDWTVIDRPCGTLWTCRCVCGTERRVNSWNLRGGRSNGCGCKRRERLRAAATKHGRSYTKEWRRENLIQNYARHLLCKAKTTCKKRGLAFNIDKLDVVIPEVCPVLGISIKIPAQGRSWNSPTLDRIDPAKGYVKGNVIVVSWRANRLKCDATISELRKLADFYSLFERPPASFAEEGPRLPFDFLKSVYLSTIGGVP